MPKTKNTAPDQHLIFKEKSITGAPFSDQNDCMQGPKTEEEKQISTTSSVKEYGGRKGPEPTRYGDWENKGIISDF